jgi:hypothetical protein
MSKTETKSTFHSTHGELALIVSVRQEYCRPSLGKLRLRSKYSKTHFDTVEPLNCIDATLWRYVVCRGDSPVASIINRPCNSIDDTTVIVIIIIIIIIITWAVVVS